ncbi:hypothetical protein THAOC_29543 [Thalassiosira oceanica]|uniref:Uncharacterized protein n=1 Tax=Thalassiosira oceanica TaxID=159749 RepID=K0RX54_THAOC|nr:hypothetical protein THAOC_29543 [Thalassiosira oceanica]|eukprot:EJK51297.1 hypothetical protein THAOC_29543 [Thalassiosira oceanica]
MNQQTKQPPLHRDHNLLDDEPAAADIDAVDAPRCRGLAWTTPTGLSTAARTAVTTGMRSCKFVVWEAGETADDGGGSRAERRRDLHHSSGSNSLTKGSNVAYLGSSKNSRYAKSTSINTINVYVSNGMSRRRGGASRNGAVGATGLLAPAPAVRANEAEATPVRSPLDYSRYSLRQRRRQHRSPSYPQPSRLPLAISLEMAKTTSRQRRPKRRNVERPVSKEEPNQKQSIKSSRSRRSRSDFGGLLEVKTTHRQRCMKRRMNSSSAKEEPNQMDLDHVD